MSYSQTTDTTTYQLNWYSHTPVLVEGTKQQVISFEGASHNPEKGYLPVFSTIFNDLYILSAELRDEKWLEVGKLDEKYLIRIDSVKSEIDLWISNGIARKHHVANVNIVPFRRNSSGQIEKLISFRLKLETGSAPVSLKPNAQFRQMSTSSVLATGDWYKMAFDKSGVYKIDYAFLENMGLRPSQINPQNIQIWSNGGGMLPELCSEERPIDLSQVNISVVGAEDGSFDKDDYIILYVQGPNVWTKESSEPFYRPKNHLYSKFSYYFLTIGTAAGNRITIADVGNPEGKILTSHRREVHEIDSYNFLSSGRRWYGEEFIDVLSRNFNIRSTGVVNGSTLYLQSSLMNKSPDNYSSSFVGTINGIPINTWPISGSGSGSTYIRLGWDHDVLDSISTNGITGATSLNLNYTYRRSVTGKGVGFLNYYAVNFEEKLIYEEGALPFRNVNSINFGTQWFEYVISKRAEVNLKVWNITSVNDIVEMKVADLGSSCSFTSQAKNIIKEYVAFSNLDFLKPISAEKIENQSIRSASTPNLLIVTHPLFKEQALRLADFRTSNDGIEVLVVTTEEVYNEFSSGAQDLVAIRDCARMFYKKNPDKFQNLLLFGDASYDYRNLANNAQATSLVPVYESEESMDPIYSYSSDDYVGLLDDNEGTWDKNDLLDIGIGRIPVNTPQEAEGVVSKLIRYATDLSNLGEWRQKATYIADSGDEDVFLQNADKLAGVVSNNYPAFNVDKVYVAAYPKENLPSVTKAPGANADIQKAFNEGALVMNYIGHGGELQLSAKDILNTADIQALSNTKYPFIVTATCDFGRYDAPSIVSGGELLFIHQNGGAIGLLTTTRPVFQFSNEKLNDAFHQSIFENQYTLGEVQMRTKNLSINTGPINRNFALLGDPSMKLALPAESVSITKVNGLDFVPYRDTLKAQSKMTISGEVRTRTGAKMADFNGVVNIIAYDKSITVNCYDDPNVTFKVQNKKIFNGSATVKNGEFTSTFIVSKDINYNVDLGRISLYASKEDGSKIDAGGYNNTIYVGSSEKNVPVDNTPPIVKVYLNDESFVQQGVTNENPLLIVKLFDESGISAVGGIGGSITATITHENSKPEEIILDSYYKSDRDSYQSGTINYRLSNQKEGFNSVKINAFDASKNGLGKESGIVEFNVVKNEKLVLNKILNYPNPFTTSTMFHFDHNRAGDDLEVLLQVFTVTGKLIKTISSYESSALTHVSGLHWDGKDDFGDNIGRGVYVYKLSVKALSDGAKKEEYQKLVILN